MNDFFLSCVVKFSETANGLKKDSMLANRILSFFLIEMAARMRGKTEVN